MVELRGLAIGYGSRVLASGLDESFAGGTLTALVGRNGAGKSTLLRVMAGLARPLAGNVFVSHESGVKSHESATQKLGDTQTTQNNFGAPRPPSGAPNESPCDSENRRDSRRRLMTVSELSQKELARVISFVSTERPRVANLRVRDVVALGRGPYTDWTGRMSQADKSIVSQSIATVGMSEFADKPIDTLSDGELQRVMIARALAQDTPVVLLDEPTAFLDFHSRREVVELLAELAHRHGKTVVFSSHELDLVREFADKVIELA